MPSRCAAPGLGEPGLMEAVTALIAEYGLVAIFLGCLAEGESIAIVGGFFAHQGVLPVWQTGAVAVVGAFLGDTILFLAGRHFGTWPSVQRLQAKPGFSHALDLARNRPRAFVFFNRFVYGMRLLGGVASGLALIPWKTFIVWNLLSSAVWASAFVSIGFFFGLSAEAVLGKALHEHERLIVSLGILAAVVLFGFLIAKRVKQREARLASQVPGGQRGDSVK